MTPHDHKSTVSPWQPLSTITCKRQKILHTIDTHPSHNKSGAWAFSYFLKSGTGLWISKPRSEFELVRKILWVFTSEEKQNIYWKHNQNRSMCSKP
jgi:hypothetical protein